MDGFLKEAEEDNEGAKRTAGKFAGVDYVHVATPDRVVHVFSAYLDDPADPKTKLHVRSNSRVGLERVESGESSLAEAEPQGYRGTIVPFLVKAKADRVIAELVLLPPVKADFLVETPKAGSQ
jgi:hypothetical protein